MTFSVDLSIRDFGGPAVVALSGELDLAGTPGVASHLITAVAACGPSVIVDLAGLDSIGYSGLAVLVRVLKWARGSGGDLSLAAPQQQVRRMLEFTGLIDVFSVYASVDEAATGARPVEYRPASAPPRPSAVIVARSCDRHRHRRARATCHPPDRRMTRRVPCRPKPAVRVPRLCRGASYPRSSRCGGARLSSRAGGWASPVRHLRSRPPRWRPPRWRRLPAVAGWPPQRRPAGRPPPPRGSGTSRAPR
jgi:anti-sigma B factor antagonist